MAVPTLYSFRRCPFAMRARMALQVSGQTVELREVRLRTKPAVLLAVSPKGTVPVLIETNGNVIDESLDIMIWALRRNDPQAWLGASAAVTLDMIGLVARCDGTFKQALDRYKYPQRFAGSDMRVERQRGTVFLDMLEDRLQRSPWLFGQHASLADFAILPFVRQFRMVDPEWFDSCPLANMRQWLARWVSSSLFEKIMLRTEPWLPNQPGVMFPPDAGLR